jgi:hypothetical protein
LNKREREREGGEMGAWVKLILAGDGAGDYGIVCGDGDAVVITSNSSIKN